jgi:UDP-galactopyranose mutase
MWFKWNSICNFIKKKSWDVEIFESRNHIGGNCYDSNIAGTIVHNYGPHIFHTNDDEVFNFLSQYTDWIEFYNRPLGNTEIGLISLPYSKKTIRELGRELSNEEIIEYIFKGYSEKQWGVPFNEIPQTIINRIPKTKDCENPSWYEGDKYQFLPKLGYTTMMNNMLDGIKVHLNVAQDEWKKHETDLTIYTGKIDEYYNYKYGFLPYRSLRFEHNFEYTRLKNSIINQNRKDVPYTRMYDHSYFTYNHKGPTIITKEYSIKHDDSNIPFYPMPFGEGTNIYNQYKILTENERNVIFLGRLATYKYLDMWMAVKQVLLKLKNT